MKTRITKSTVKSFIKKNADNLFIDVIYCITVNHSVKRYYNDGFKKTTFDSDNAKNTLGIEGAWFVGQSRDYFECYEDSTYSGIRVFNSCGTFVLATKR